MSQQAVRDFFAKAVSDQQLLARLKGSDDLPTIVSIAAGEGFQFSVNDLEAVNPPQRASGPADSQLKPPGGDTMYCSQGGCTYTSYAAKCVDTVPQTQEA